MVEIIDVSKNFGTVKALGGVTLTVGEKSVFGLVGSNGSGKSTLLRIMMDIYKADSGRVLYDGEDIAKKAKLKEKVFLIAEDQYFFPGSSVEEMSRFFRCFYKNYEKEAFVKYCGLFEIDRKSKLSELSKGIRKQIMIFNALASHPKVILCDETFDGLDPVVRRAVKSLFLERVEQEGMSMLIASHNLSEIEGMCDNLGLLHKGKTELVGDIDCIKGNSCAAIVAYPEDEAEAQLAKLSAVTSHLEHGAGRIVLRGSVEEVKARIAATDPDYFKILPMTLEEIFISEMEVRGYERTLFCAEG
ncbi:MAG: ABC transporter ATP-binding protein [Clostridia bacterium]|nr:ABC transporter ATP-binding protein [Clostridia bacterium]